MKFKKIHLWKILQNQLISLKLGKKGKNEAFPPAFPVYTAHQNNQVADKVKPFLQ